MAEVNKVDLNLGHKIANPFKTTRKSDTNPFKYSNFEGNTLQFADVFEGYDQKNANQISFKGNCLNAINKMKMISSSVMGSLTKMHNSITEPISNFVNRITNSEIYKGISNVLNYDVTKGLSDSFSHIKNNVNNKFASIGKSVTDLGNNIKDRWSALVANVHHEKISAETPVAELRELWIKENGLSVNNAEVKVA